MLYRYFLILIAVAAALAGVQIPNFVHQYEARLQSHTNEVRTNLRGFQQIADRYHNGSLDALILQHERSTDPTFRAEADPIKNMVHRLRGFEMQRIGLDTGLAGKIGYLVARGDRELLEETRNGYSFNVPMTEEALLAGGVFTLVVLLLTELLCAILRLLLAPRSRNGMYLPTRR